MILNIALAAVTGTSRDLGCRYWLQLKFYPLSENISRGRPCPAMNRLREAKKALVRSNTGSRWAALVVKHMKTHTYAFTRTGLRVCSLYE